MIKQIRSEISDGNSYLIEDNGYAIIIDPGQGRALFNEIDNCGCIPEYIFLTHEHFDHIQNLEEIREKYNVPVVACELCSERIQGVDTNLSAIADILHYFKTGVIPEVEAERFVCNKADITYGDSFELNWHGHSFAFQRIPGHSPGSVMITMDDKDVFSGDYMIYGQEEILRLKGGSAEEYEKFTKPVLNKIPDGTPIHPGHREEYIKGD